MSGKAAPRRGLTVVKLGGSFALSPDLPGILDVIGEAVTPIVLVAGGGPFADAVRDAQPRMGFHDRAAHKMALMAMAQFAEALAALNRRLRPARDLAAIRAALGAGAVPVWSPWPMADGLEHLPESWQLTSDSLAAWLAGRLGADYLMMLKYGDAPSDLVVAAANGIVDPLFPDYANASGAAIRWVAPAQPGALAAMLGADLRERLPA